MRSPLSILLQISFACISETLMSLCSMFVLDVAWSCPRAVGIFCLKDSFHQQSFKELSIYHNGLYYPTFVKFLEKEIHCGRNSLQRKTNEPTSQYLCHADLCQGNPWNWTWDKSYIRGAKCHNFIRLLVQMGKTEGKKDRFVSHTTEEQPQTSRLALNTVVIDIL